jgi:hypothetical protein
MLLNESLDFAAPKSGQFSESDAGQEWLLSSCMIVYPCLADAKPYRDLGDRQ